MKKIICYFDPTVRKVLVEKETESGEKKLTLSSPFNFVYTGEIVARVIDIDNEDQIPTRLDPGCTYYQVIDFRILKADAGIYYDDASKSYKAQSYGFVVLEGEKLRWISPLTVSKDRLKAYFSVYPTKAGKLPSYADIEEALHKYRILARIEQKKIEEQLNAVDPANPRFTRILVAQGKEPVNGHDEYFLPLINLEKKAGEIKADGSIDFKEVGSIVEVKKGQDILRRVPGIKPVDGYDIYGDKTYAQFERPEGYLKGDNIEQSKHDENIFVAAIDGCVDVDGKKISVLPIAIIHGDVNYDTGNIDFDGSVHIMGSVIPGFSVKARGDIIIEKGVEDAYIEAGGDVTVKLGVVGKGNAKIIAKGKVTAKYLQHVFVEAGDEIVVDTSIINSEIFSNKRISVVAREGKIIGGKATALYEIVVNVSGSPNETETQLAVGRNLDIERELSAIQKEISKWRANVEENMRQLKVSFGESVFENPREFINRLPVAKKKTCLLLLKELSNNNRELKRLVEQSREVQEKLKLEREPYIIIRNKAYPGTVINIKKSVRRVDSPIDNVKYYEDPEDKIIRFSPAV